MQYCFFLDTKGLSASEWAAWVQAVGSIAAILAAVLIATWQHRKEAASQERAAQTRARSLAFTLRPSLGRYLTMLETQVRAFEQKPRRVSFADFQEGITSPNDILAFSTNSYELGKASRPFQDLLMHADLSMGYASQAAHLERNGAPYDVVEAAALAFGKKAHSDALKTMGAIYSMFSEDRESKLVLPK